MSKETAYITCLCQENVPLLLAHAVCTNYFISDSFIITSFTQVWVVFHNWKIQEKEKIPS